MLFPVYISVYMNPSQTCQSQTDSALRDTVRYKKAPAFSCRCFNHKGFWKPFPWSQQGLNLWPPDYESGESRSEILAFCRNNSLDLGRSAFSIISKCSPSDANRSICYTMIHIAFCPIPVLVIFRIFEIMISWKCRYIYFEQVIIIIHVNGS